MEAPRPKSRPPIEVGARVLEVGAYTLILSMDASPSPAGEGDRVTVVVSVRNLFTDPIYIAVTGVFDGTEFPLTPDYVAVNPGESHLFSGNFIMPNKAVRVYAWSFYWTGTEWYPDDEAFIDVKLAAIPEPIPEPAFRNLTVTISR